MDFVEAPERVATGVTRATCAEAQPGSRESVAADAVATRAATPDRPVTRRSSSPAWAAPRIATVSSSPIYLESADVRNGSWPHPRHHEATTGRAAVSRPVYGFVASMLTCQLMP